MTAIPVRLSNGFEWEASLNFGRNKNEVEELYGAAASVWHRSLSVKVVAVRTESRCPPPAEGPPRHAAM